jgi:hypothetical protein
MRIETFFKILLSTCLIFSIQEASASLPDSFTKSLLHFEGSLHDESGKTWYASGNAHLTTGNRKVGSYSLYLDGSYDYIHTADSSDWTLGVNDFTIDMYVISYGTGPGTLLTQSVNAATSNSSIAVVVNRNGVGSASLYMSNGVDWDYITHTPAGLINDGNWHHLAFVRNSSNIYIFVDGVIRASRTIPASFTVGNSSLSMQIGAQQREDFFHGYIDEVHFTKGLARWTGPFIPPGELPFAPTNLAATQGEDSKVSLSWNPVANASYYVIKRSTAAGGPYTSINSHASTSYADTSVSNGTTYYYVISAVNSNGEGANSNEAAATPRAPILTSLVVTPNSLNLAAGATQHLKVTANYSNGTTQDVTSSSNFTSGAPGVASVNSAGVVTGVSSGQVDIFVDHQGRSIRTHVIVYEYNVNVLHNPDFEIYSGKLNGFPDGWNAYGPAGSEGIFQVVAVPAYSGQQAESASVTIPDLQTGTDWVYYQAFPIVPDLNFSASGHVNVSSISNGKIVLRAYFYDISHNFIGSVDSPALVGPTGNYSALQLNGSIPSNAKSLTYAVVFIATGNNASASIHVDALDFHYTSGH